jgi:hypothetical protein
MGLRIEDSGRYVLREDAHGHRFLVLNEERWFVWIEGQKSPLIVRTGPGHEKLRALRRGRFYLVDFQDDPNFRDMPHLFLQVGERYQEFLLPNGLPDERDPQKRFVVTRKFVAKDELERYLAANTSRTRAETPRRSGRRPSARAGAARTRAGARSRAP